MKIETLGFALTDWGTVAREEHKGVTGTSFWRTRQFGEVRVRIVEYSPGYSADHWCKKGHIIHCLEGRVESELDDGRRLVLTAGMSYLLADDSEAHRFATGDAGARLFVVD
ncbi:MAG: DHCW motif cupin fold protein [Pseudomonadota bacterium]